MNDDEDLELAALQRQLDDAFETTRPRAGYEDELWLRMQTRRPFWSRLQDALTGLIDGLREAPAVPAAAVAAVLVVAVGAGIWSLSGIARPAGPASLAARSGFGGAQDTAYEGAFGRIPAPSLQSGLTEAVFPPKSTGPEAGQAAGNLYLGSANLVWAGQLSTSVTSAPVYRYQEPSATAFDQFASSLRASPQTGATHAGYQGSYSGDGFTLLVRGSTPLPSGEPFYFLTPNQTGAASATGAPDIANAYLAVHGLTPAWPNVMVVDQVGDTIRVRYLRQFPVPGQADAYAVDGLGARYGLEVDVSGGRLQLVAGPMPLSLDTGTYSTISAADAVRSAVSTSPSGPGTITPLPTVRLTSAELVYALAWAGDHSFYEPAYLFSGTFTYNGTTYVKRVLVPAVVPSQRSS